ncbi:translation initiation factor IF-2 [Candidatus Dependentiae bacterium]|nr:translation initiation factor IF-2 [Candidatus Dependentiae bacterium]
MQSMRVYEFAKLLSVSNKELIAELATNGFEVKSHMAALSPEAIDFLNKKVTEKKNLESAQKQVPSKDEKAALHTQSRVDKPQATKIETPQPAPKEAPALRPQAPRVFTEQKVATRITEEPMSSIEVVAVPMTVGQLAEKIKKPASELIITLLRQGIVCAKNQLLTEKMIESIGRQFGFSVVAPKAEKRDVQQRVSVATQGEHLRKPIVVIIGHVDHGKTTLLDFIRKTRVASREKGGITQHLGAYEAETPQGGLIFLDTPGHEAFKNIRGRGLNIADIAVLVVAADDSVMPQTVEALKTAQAAQVPIIVAVNKIDKADKTRLEVVKRDLTRYDLVPEEWGGQTVIVPISGKTGQGVDQLLELIVLQSQIMDLRSQEDRTAQGFVLESKQEKGRGPVATVICRDGTLHVGDYFLAGTLVGKVTSLVNSYGHQLKKVGPSVPVQVGGFTELPQAGDVFKAISEAEYKKVRDGRSTGVQPVLAKKVFSGEGINFIVKTDSTLTQEALITSLEKVSEKMDEKFQIIAAGVGNITESDIEFASDTRSQIIALHVKVEPSAALAAQKTKVSIRLYDIIYKLLEDVEAQLQKAAPIKMVAKKIGEAVVRKVFDIKNVGVIAGSYVKEGRFVRDARVTVWRGKKKVAEGPIRGLERDRKSVKEVHAGFEFAFLVDGFNEWEVDDRVECFIDIPDNK